MEIVNNNKHTIIKNNGVFNYKYNQYIVLEYCSIVNEKEEVKHPTGKKQILKIYNLWNIKNGI